MRYRILDDGEVWAKIHEGRTVYCADMRNERIFNVTSLKVGTINEYLCDDHTIFVEDIAPNYDNEDGE